MFTLMITIDDEELTREVAGAAVESPRARVVRILRHMTNRIERDPSIGTRPVLLNGKAVGEVTFLEPRPARLVIDGEEPTDHPSHGHAVAALIEFARGIGGKLQLVEETRYLVLESGTGAPLAAATITPGVQG
ncbi:hypothetical protein PBI_MALAGASYROSE_75 [Mycobacterium phage MalagasyRose]|uniref:Uncharacterized protein n=1 Tax=Mycobacterium phage MalagasyRose TaxID=2599870 RepID=A0A5J6TDD1_9CAUD|nr:hypothetical protein QEH39_gp13 [Mycobacterium phage MalagasyRose]QFG08923.1 hypothetical protein PBI_MALAGASYROSE_75 [Mycobacterium phage MalagasyRose]